MPVIQSPETVFLLQLYSQYARSELCSAARHYGIPEPSWPVSLQHGTDYFLPYIVALIAIRLGDSLDVHAAHQYYQVLYLSIVTSRQILNMPMVNKQLSMWSESMSTLLMVHHYGRPTHALTELRRRLRRLRIHPNMYTFGHFLQANAVYWKQRVELRPDLPRSVNPQSDVYIGSTSITYPSREHNRRAKLLGIQHGQFINAEPALRWWHHFGNYDEFATWVIFTDPDHTVTWTQEHALISIYQPSLNWPYIYRRYKNKSPLATRLPGFLPNSPDPGLANAFSSACAGGVVQSMAGTSIGWRSNTPRPGQSSLASPRSTSNLGSRKNNFVVDGTQTWIYMLYTGCQAMWNNPIGIEFGIFCEEFLISANSNNPRSTCCCGYRGFLIPIITGPPGKSFVGLFSTIATGLFHSTCSARSWRRPLTLEFIRSCGTSRRFRTVTSSHPPDHHRVSAQPG